MAKGGISNPEIVAVTLGHGLSQLIPSVAAGVPANAGESKVVP